MIDEHLTYISEILAKRMQKRGNFDNEVMRVMEVKKRKEFDKTKMERQVRKFLSSKRYAREQLLGLDRDLRRIAEEEAIAIENLDKVDATIKLYEKLAKRFELTSDYRKRLNKIVDAHHEYNAKIAEIVAPKRYFERNADLTEKEQLKIVFKILTEQEDTLTREVIFKDVFDMEHFKDYIKSVVRSFKTPSVMGYKPTYKTDYIWVTVSTPPKMWTEDMSQEVYTALAGYVTSEVSRTITVRVVESQRCMDNPSTCSRRTRQTRRHGSLRRNAESLQQIKRLRTIPLTIVPTRTWRTRNKHHQRNQPRKRLRANSHQRQRQQQETSLVSRSFLFLLPQNFCFIQPFELWFCVSSLASRFGLLGFLLV